MSRKRRVRRILIGNTLEGKPIYIDISTLVRTRLLVQANSGGGKSYFVRRLLEQSHGSLQHIVLDVEGEFSTLRQKFDYVLAAKGGDTPVDPRGAALLAERLLELKVSALIDLYELPHQERIRFVKHFLDALTNARKELWHPTLIVIDEAHLFCPQQSRKESPSASAVMDLCTRGRKRGFCAVLATQRLSKLHKDAAAECNNKLIGRTSMDVDMKRASDELGFASKEQRLSLRSLHPGEFYAFGPAITREVTQVKVGAVITAHPKAGTSLRYRTAPPTRAVKKLLPKLADLPAEQEQRELTVKEMKRAHHADQEKIAALERQLKAHPTTVEKLRVVERSMLRARERQALSRIADAIYGVRKSADKLTTRTYDALSPLETVLKRIDLHTAGEPQGSTRAPAVPSRSPQAERRGPTTAPARSEAGADAGQPVLKSLVTREGVLDLSRDNAATRILKALAKVGGRANAQRIGSLSGVPARRSTFRLGIMHLRRADLVTGDAKQNFELTDLGREVTASISVAPNDGASALAHWRKELGRGVARQMFEALLAAGLDGLVASELGEKAGADPAISTFRLGISKLRALDLITGDRERFFVQPGLVEHGKNDDRMVRSHGQSDTGKTQTRRTW